MIPDAKSQTLLPSIREKVVPDSIVYTDYYRSSNALDVSEFKHYRLNHSKLFADKHNHLNGIETFGNQAKRHLRKYNGIPKHHFSLFLKECEWRFNYGSPRQLKKHLAPLGPLSYPIMISYASPNDFAPESLRTYILDAHPLTDMILIEFKLRLSGKHEKDLLNLALISGLLSMEFFQH